MTAGVGRGARKDSRRRAREAALQILYHWDIGRSEVHQAVETYFEQQWPDAGPPPAELRAFATALATETVERLPAIDALIAETAERWRPERMAVVDRLILRMAICELLRGRDASASAGVHAPAAVVINEALELGRTFSAEESVKFINGMLDAVRKKIGRP